MILYSVGLATYESHSGDYVMRYLLWYESDNNLCSSILLWKDAGHHVVQAKLDC